MPQTMKTATKATHKNMSVHVQKGDNDQHGQNSPKFGQYFCLPLFLSVTVCVSEEATKKGKFSTFFKQICVSIKCAVCGFVSVCLTIMRVALRVRERASRREIELVLAFICDMSHCVRQLIKSKFVEADSKRMFNTQFQSFLHNL